MLCSWRNRTSFNGTSIKFCCIVMTELISRIQIISWLKIITSETAGCDTCCTFRENITYSVPQYRKVAYVIQELTTFLHLSIAMLETKICLEDYTRSPAHWDHLALFCVNDQISIERFLQIFGRFIHVVL